MTQRDEFYVGYRGRMPPGTARFLRFFVASVTGGALLIALAFAALGTRFPVKRFEFGVERTFVGWIREDPVPLLVVAGPDGVLSSYLLAHGGTKFGAGPLIEGRDGDFVRLRGTLIYREDQTMLDLVPGSVARIEGEAAPGASFTDLGRHRLRGEIVDSKCFLGVMNPATGKVHRACAARCISSGTPPLLRVGGHAGVSLQLLLVGPKGEALNREVLPFVAEPVAIEGRVTRQGQLLVLWTDVAAIERL